MTDYPDIDLIQNMQKNIDGCDASFEPAGHIASTIVAKGFIWGADPTALLAEVPGGGFDVLILADLLFRHKEHPDLVKTIRECLKKTRSAKAYVFFTSYRPWKRELDMKFFDIAREDGFLVEQVEERKLEKRIWDLTNFFIKVPRKTFFRETMKKLMERIKKGFPGKEWF